MMQRRDRAVNPIRAILCAGVAIAACFVQRASHAADSPKVFNVREFGAAGDGKTLDTAAIQKALDACGKAGGGTVRFPAGTYLSKPVTLRTKTTLFLDQGAMLKATDEPKDYLPPDVTWEDVLAGRSKGPFTPFIGGKDLTDVTIAGNGIIDGSGGKWWVPAEEARRKTSGYTLPRPRLIALTRVNNLLVRDVTLQNSPTFHLVPTECEDVVITNVTFSAPAGSANTDAIDPSVSRRVLITKCLIDVGDDNVAIKSGRKIEGREFACEDITITDCVCKHGHGISIGSETVGGVRNVTIRNCTFEDTDNGLRIKSYRGRGGVVENIVYENITMKRMNPTAITITCYYPKIPATDEAQPVTGETPLFRNIRISNVKGTATKAAGVIVGLPESIATNIVLENVELTAPAGLMIRNARGVRLKNVKVTVEKGEPFLVENSEVEGLPGVKGDESKVK
jgi:polygalacturonase